MNWRAAVLCGIGFLVLIPESAEAQWGARRRRGVVQSPYGPLYDTRSPEWRRARGDLRVYQQLMEEKLQRQQQLRFEREQRLRQRGQRRGAGGELVGSPVDPRPEQPVEAIDGQPGRPRKRPSDRQAPAPRSQPPRPSESVSDPELPEKSGKRDATASRPNPRSPN